MRLKIGFLLQVFKPKVSSSQAHSAAEVTPGPPPPQRISEPFCLPVVLTPQIGLYWIYAF